MELVAPPADAALGDRVSVPDIEPVKPLGANKIKRQKVLEKVLEHLRTNSDRCVTYKGVAVQTSAGTCSVASLIDAKVV